MKNYFYLVTLTFSIFILFEACGDKTTSPVIIKEVYQTLRNEDDNVDSPAFWEGIDGENCIISTAKSANVLIVDDAGTGKNIKRIGSKGETLGQLSRPNGISVADDFVFVVERDNHRVQVFNLPEFESLGTFGDSLLIKPYGIFVYKTNENNYSVFVTDNYENGNDIVPPDNELNKRVQKYLVNIKNAKMKVSFEKYFGETSGNGILRIVESIYGDTANNVLLIAEEDTSRSSVKVYNLNGNYSGKDFGSDIFKGQVEGISLYDDGKGGGFWIITDQSKKHNLFNIFDRKTFKYLASFMGPNTFNTDGIWITNKSFGNFSKGAFFAVNNDGNVSAFDLKEIINLLPSKE